MISQRNRKSTEKGQNYNAERKRKSCKAFAKRLKNFKKDIEDNSRQFDNVHIVHSDLEILQQQLVDFKKEYESWLAHLTDQEEIHEANQWYEDKRHEMDVFLAGMKDWIIIAKQHIERHLEKTPSEQSSSSRRSTVAERIRLAELQAQSTMLKKRQVLRNQMEQLELEEQMAIAKAREQIFLDEERQEISSRQTHPCLHYRRDEQAPFSTHSFPGFWSRDHKDDVPPSFTDHPKVHDNEEVLPASPLNVRPTPLTVKVSPIPSSLAPRAGTYSHGRAVGFNVPPSFIDRLKAQDNEQVLPASPLNVHPTPRAVRVSPIPSSLAPRADTYSHGRVVGLETKLEMPFSIQEDQARNAVTLATFLDRQTKLTEIISEQNMRSSLPSLLLSTFTNDPSDYVTFISNFESQIESKVQSSEIRLRYLEQYLQGEAKELIKGCQYKDPQLGYPEAKKLLKAKYGDPYKISNAYIKKITEWPTITAGNDQELEQLSAYLTQCVSAMQSISYLHILDHPHNLQSLIKKLPPYLQDRWRRKVTDLRESSDQLPGFKYLSDFLRYEAKIVSDPVFSRQALANTVNKGQQLKSSSKTTDYQRGRYVRATSHATCTETPSDKCVLCSEGTHDLDDCEHYKEKSLEDRKKFLTEKQMCYGCYKVGHRSRGCMQKRKCSICQGYHPTGLHDHNFVPRTKTSEGKPSESHLSSNTVLEYSLAKLPIVPIKLSYGNRYVKTYALLDSCSTGTFITDSVYKQLQIEGTDTKILIGTVNGKVLQNSKALTGLTVSDLKGENVIELPKTFTREEIPACRRNISTKETAQKWHHLQRIADSIPECRTSTKVGLLIGTNCPKALEPKDVIPCPDVGPYAVLTFAGWTIIGSDSMTNNHSIHRVHLVSDTKEVISPEMLNKMMELEFTDRKTDNSLTAYSQDDKRFLHVMESRVTKEGNHYQLPLPFKDEETVLPNNKELCVSRAMWLKRKLLNDKKLHADYTKFMQDLQDNDYASEMTDTATTAWYLPHHGVYHPHKPGKIRVVFDCSAKFNNVSLNSQLLQGPDLTSSLVGVLSRFRKEPVAFQADIEAMFHQVRVIPEHRDFLRYLWWPNGDLSQALHEYRMNVHLFGAVSSPSCASYAVRRTAEEAEPKVGKETADVLKQNFYVDDCLRSEETDAKAIERLQGTIQACKMGGFHLTKITSNSRAVLESVPKDDRSKEVQKVDLTFEKLPTERALGVQWDIQNDTFGFNIALKDKPLTRRGILSTISSVYDPLGIAAPVLLKGKKILQELCKSNSEWDEPIPDEYYYQWERWRSQLPMLQDVTINRCLKPSDFGVIIEQQVHSFSDASTTGYGQVSYLRQVNDKGEIHCAFLTGKSRVAPIKSVTVPRLELTAAVVSSKLGNKIVQELDLPKETSTFWTDSTTVIKYVTNEQNRYETYVANRVQSIRDVTNPTQWKYVRSKDNPADDASRGIEVEDFESEHRWLKGPPFLWKPETEWPTSPDEETHNETTTVHSTSIKEQPSNITTLFERFSNWLTLKRVIARILRLSPQRRHNKNPTQDLTVAETEEAEIVILKNTQRGAFSTELDVLHALHSHSYSSQRSLLKEKKLLLKKSSPLYKLDPFVDSQGLLRVGGRIGQANQLDESTKYPVILPKKNHVTSLIIRYSHEKMAHAGRGITLNHLRERYWILNANSSVRSCISKCVRCRRLRGSNVKQKMADLPRCRLSNEPPFTYCGVDLFGPFTVKDGRKEVKRYGVIFTCLSSRAVHIETTTSLETDSFLNALRRFIARRGPVREIRSDNGTNLVGAEKELKLALKELDVSRLQNYLSSKHNADLITWYRNPPAASHMGGAWERQIRTIRSILKSLMYEHGHALDDESLRTLLTEVENIVNSRPLTFPSSDPQDPNPLTPNHILTMKSQVLLPPPGVFQREDVYLRKRWRRVQYLTNLFWSKWKHEYVQSLQPRPKWNQTNRNLQVGDIVIIKQETPRNEWPLGRVTDVNADQQGLVRSATVKTQTSTLHRPISKLVVLLENSLDG